MTFVEQIKKTASVYRRWGWNVIPLRNYEKNPASANKSWKHLQTRLATNQEFKKMFDQPDLTGLGLITGKISGIYVLDEDSYKKGKKISTYSPMLVETVNKGKHHYRSFNPQIKQLGLRKGVYVEGKGEGGFVVLPPSQVKRHDGTIGSYRWLRKCEISKLPLVTQEDLCGLSVQSRKFDRNESIGREIGERHPTLLSLANSLMNDVLLGRTAERVAFEILAGVNKTYKPPKPQSELRQIWKDARNFVKENPPDKNEPLAKPKKLKDLVIKRMLERELERKAPKTGFPELDRLIKGFIPKHLVTLTGDTNTGKSSLACNFAERLARQGKKTLYIALEPDSTVLDFVATIQTKKTFDDLTKEDFEKLPDEIEIYTSEIKSFSDLKRAIEKNINDYSLIVIDHLGYFVEESRGETFVRKQSNLLKELALFANSSLTTILVIAHLRKMDRQKKALPTLDDISGSAAFKQDSDEVLILVREIKSGDKYGVEFSSSGGIIVAKQKSTGSNGFAPIIYSEKSAYITSPDESNFDDLVDYYEKTYSDQFEQNKGGTDG